jgi:uncharacterized protein YaaN involved in tellurite resistance
MCLLMKYINIKLPRLTKPTNPIIQIQTLASSYFKIYDALKSAMAIKETNLDSLNACF